MPNLSKSAVRDYECAFADDVIQNCRHYLTVSCRVIMSIPWLLMTWRRKEPGHPQPWYLTYRILLSCIQTQHRSLVTYHAVYEPQTEASLPTSQLNDERLPMIRFFTGTHWHVVWKGQNNQSVSQSANKTVHNSISQPLDPGINLPINNTHYLWWSKRGTPICLLDMVQNQTSDNGKLRKITI